jgi:mannose-1-phosphate guanylyltransferase/mannose-6-phosphate isomerase
MAGGAGERFWPLSRRARPKPLLRLLGRASLLDATLARARRLAPPARTWLVCTAENAPALRAASRLPASRVLVEPRARDTAMAIAYAAARIEARDPGAVLAVLPADHAIPDAKAFAAAMRRAARAAMRGDALVTLGVRPTRPDTGYGYIEPGAPIGRAHPGLRRVERFVEKPDARRARAWIRRGGWLWNAGIFAWKAAVVLDEIGRCAPELAGAVALMRRGRARPAAVARAYRCAASLPIDRAVLERSDRVWTLPARFRWSDVGGFDRLAEELGVAGGPSRVLGSGRALLADAAGNFVWTGDRLVALLGVRDLAVIDAGDALLVASLARSPEVRRLVERLRRDGRSELL